MALRNKTARNIWLGKKLPSSLENQLVRHFITDLFIRYKNSLQNYVSMFSRGFKGAFYNSMGSHSDLIA